MSEAGTTVDHRWRWPRAMAAVGGTVVAVGAILALPSWLSSSAPTGPSVPRPPAPNGPVVPGSTTWHTLRCPPVDRVGCAAPSLIDHGGAVLYSLGGRRQEVRADSPFGNALSMTLPPSRRDRWVLVGAERTGADSRLEVLLDEGEPIAVPPGRLTLLSVRGHRPVDVHIADQGRPRDGETLRIEEYASR